MKYQYIMHGWHLSYFSGKLRSYLRYKGLNFRDRPVNAFDMVVRIPKKTGVVVMPVLQTDRGEWLQDTTEIITTLEQRHPQPSITPASPRQTIAAMLLEVWADEHWIPTAMHYRWSFPDNYALFRRDAGKALLPFIPGPLRNRFVKTQVADKMRSYLPGVGVVPEQFSAMEVWTGQMLDHLELHFSEHDYLLGGRPSVADFGLIGPLYAHLGRDPVPKRELLDTRPRLQAWVARAHNGEPATGDFLADDVIPATLTPVFASIFSEFYPMLDGIVTLVNDFVAAKSSAPGLALPRSLGMIRFPMAGQAFSRRAVPYTLWMMQRLRAHYQALPAAERQAVDQWFASQGQGSLNDLNLGPALQRRGLATRLAKSSAATPSPAPAAVASALTP